MAKAHRDFNGKSFLRKTGLPTLKAYLQHQNHPLQHLVEAILNDDDFNKESVKLYEQFDSSENPNQQKDLHNWALINDLASEKGMAEMRIACMDLDLGYLITDQETPHCLAHKLYIQEPYAFHHAYALLQIDYVEGWQLYRGKAISPLQENLKEATYQFEQGLHNLLRQYGQGHHVNVDLHESHGRIILDTRYEGPLVRHEDFDQSGRLRATSIRKPMEIGLVYWPDTAVLKVKTPRGQHNLNTAIKQQFAYAFLTNPQGLIDVSEGQIVNLNELKTRRVFPPANAEEEIQDIRLTSLVCRLFPGSRDKITLYSPEGLVWERINQLGLNVTSMELFSAGIQFIFKGVRRGRYRTVQITTKNNRVNLNTSQRDEVISGYLQRIGILNV